MKPRLPVWLPAHRVVMLAVAIAIVAWCAMSMRWHWIPDYADLALQGLWRTVWMLACSMCIGFVLALALGFAQEAGPWYLPAPASAFCTVIRGTPLLLQIWLLYYGLGSLFPQSPGFETVNSGPIFEKPGPTRCWHYPCLSPVTKGKSCVVRSRTWPVANWNQHAPSA